MASKSCCVTYKYILFKTKLKHYCAVLRSLLIRCEDTSQIDHFVEERERKYHKYLLFSKGGTRTCTRRSKNDHRYKKEEIGLL